MWSCVNEYILCIICETLFFIFNFYKYRYECSYDLYFICYYLLVLIKYINCSIAIVFVIVSNEKYSSYLYEQSCILSHIGQHVGKSRLYQVIKDINYCSLVISANLKTHLQNFNYFYNCTIKYK